jgi:hypothetical protein
MKSLTILDYFTKRNNPAVALQKKIAMDLIFTYFFNYSLPIQQNKDNFRGSFVLSNFFFDTKGSQSLKKRN